MPWQGSTINETWANVTNSIYEDEQDELQEDIKTLQNDVIDETTTNTSLINVVSKDKKDSHRNRIMHKVLCKIISKRPKLYALKKYGLFLHHSD